MNYALVGAFVLALGVALVVGVLWLGSGGVFGRHDTLYLAIEDESVAGLNLNAPVKYNGVAVGQVQDIRLDPVDPQRVRLVLAIERGTPVKEDTLAVLNTQGLTGIAYVELSGGTAAAAPLHASAGEPYPVIRTKPSLGFRLESVLTSAAAKLDRISSNLDAVFSDQNRAALTSTLADLAALTQTLARRKGALDAGISSAARALDGVAQASAAAIPVIERIGRGADALESMGNAAALASRNAGATVDALGGDARRLIDSTTPELQRVLGNLEALSASMQQLAVQAGRNPGGILRGPSPVPEGPGETPDARRRP